MEKKITVAIAFIGCLLAGVATSAQVHIGVTTGANSTFVLDKGLSEDPRYNSQMTYNFSPIGFSFGVDISPTFGIQLESILANHGQVFEILDVAKQVVGRREIDVSYIQLPLLLKFMNGSTKTARTNFSIGPQLALLRSGVETMEYDASTQHVADPAEIQQLIDQGYSPTQNPDGSYNLQALSVTEVLSSNAAEEIRRFNDSELQIAASFGLDIDLAKHIYLSTLIRANYSFTDMRNGDLIDLIKTNSIDGLIDKRANLAVGLQVGIHYMFGEVKSYSNK